MQKIWAAHGLKPHLARRFKLSTDKLFAGKLRDVVGLHIDPPERALGAVGRREVADAGS